MTRVRPKKAVRPYDPIGAQAHGMAARAAAAPRLLGLPLPVEELRDRVRHFALDLYSPVDAQPLVQAVTFPCRGSVQHSVNAYEVAGLQQQGLSCPRCWTPYDAAAPPPPANDALRARALAYCRIVEKLPAEARSQPAAALSPAELQCLVAVVEGAGLRAEGQVTVSCSWAGSPNRHTQPQNLRPVRYKPFP